MHRLFFLLLQLQFLFFLASCGNMRAEKLIGLPSQELIAEYGPPTQILSDGAKGNIMPDGSFQPKDFFLPTKENLKETLKLSARLLELDWFPDFSTNDWQRLSRSLDIRHGITHPKQVSDLFVSDDALADTRAGLGWYMSTINEFQSQLMTKYGRGHC